MSSRRDEMDSRNGNRRLTKACKSAAFVQNGTGFTLVELLIAMTILLILAALTIRLLNATLNSDRIKTGSRELQSFLAGARDRAIYAGAPRGVRLLPDPVDPTTVRNFVYIGAPTTYTDGNPITIGAAGVVTGPTATLNAWTALWNRGLFTNGTPIQLTQGATLINSYMTVSATGIGASGPTGFVITTVPASTFPINSPPGANYTLQLPPSILPGEEARSLPTGIVIDLDNSVLPAGWGSSGAYSTPLDMLFSPSGNVTGTVSSAGRVHFVLSDVVDASVPVPVPTNTLVTGVPLLDASSTWQGTTAYTLETWVVPTPQNYMAFRCIGAGTSGASQPPSFATAAPGQTITDGSATWQCYIPKPRLIVSVATQTGRVTTSPIDPNDRFRFAESGEVTQ
jgi:prepilin-type N-terminal cleavage/methylation domain-containing protein